MTNSTIALVLAAAVSCLTFATAALAFWTNLRNSRKIDDQSGTLRQISLNVDGRLDGLTARVEQLITALARAGEPIPADPNGKLPG